MIDLIESVPDCPKCGEAMKKFPFKSFDIPNEKQDWVCINCPVNFLRYGKLSTDTE